MKKEKRKKQDWKPFLRLVRQTKLPYGWILLCIASSLLVAQLNLMFPSYTEQISAGDFSTKIIVATLAVLIAGAFADTLYQSVCMIVKGMISERFRNTLWDKVIRLPLRFYDKNGSSEVISRVVEDTTLLSDFLTDDIAGLVSNVYTLVGTAIILFSYDWRLVMAELIIIPMIILMGIVKGRVDFKWNNTLQLRVAELTGGISEILTNIPLVKIFVQEEKATKQSEEKTGELYKTKMKMTWITNAFSSISTLLTVAESLIVIFFGIYLIRRNIITVSIWVAFYLYATNLSGSVDSIMSIWTDLKTAQGAMRRISDLSETEEDAYDTGIPFKQENKDLRFDHVSFTYDEAPVLQDLSFTIPSGKTTAIVGMSGAGKSTILNLLERFYNPDNGSIFYGEHAISDYTLRSWRNAVGYVTQSAWLIDGTVRDNLLYQDETPLSDAQLLEQLDNIGMTKLLSELSNGLDTEVGEGGCNLSGGQRQRICIARMLLHPPAIVLLDEVTSNLDICAEKDTEQLIHEKLKDCTVILITHKIRNVKHADQIIVLEDGQAKTCGIHENLVAQDGWYKEMYQKQVLTGGATE